MADVAHPNVVNVYDLVESDDGMPLLVMEYVPGGTLAATLGGEPLEPHLAAQCVATLADAVTSIHERDFLHLDLKPSNVLMDKGHLLQTNATPRSMPT